MPDAPTLPDAPPRPVAEAGLLAAADGRPDAGRAWRRSDLWAWARVLGGAVLFAVLLRTCAFEAYRIPSTSMEDTLLVGDFVLVSKLHYGPRVFGRRWPGLGEVARGDVVVFHYPPGLEEPLERRMPYIKRAVGLPGDTVAIRDKTVRVGGSPVPFPRAGRQYWEVRRDGPLSIDTLRALGLGGRVERLARGSWIAEATAAEAERLSAVVGVAAVEPLVRPAGDGSAAFPASLRFSLDN